MVEVSSSSRLVAGLALILVPTIAYGGSAILQLVLGRIPGYHENLLRKAFFRAGHAHAGVLVLLTLISLLFVDGAALPDALKALVRWSLFATPLLVSAGFFLSVLPTKAERPGPPLRSPLSRYRHLERRNTDARCRTPESVIVAQIFSASFLLVAPFWALLVFLPGWRWTAQIARSPWLAAPAALLYTGLVLPQLFGVLGAVAQPDLTSIMALLGTPAGATIAWVHFLAFDLFVGRWIYLDSRERGLSPLLVSPVLLFTLLLAPLGFLLYLVVRTSAPQPGKTP